MVRASGLMILMAVAGCVGESRPYDTCPYEVREYLACGCGCCAGTQPVLMCIPTSAPCLSEIIAEDQALKGSPSCAFAGCAQGVQYSPCFDEQS